MSELLDKEYVKIPTSAERCALERELRVERAKKILPFGVGYLDKALGGIFKNDLIVLSGPTGSGKTELACHIASFNAQLGVRVVYFALEAENMEIESRAKFKIAANKYFSIPSKERDYIDGVCYRNWYMDCIGEKFKPYEDYAEKTFINSYGTLTTIYRENEFTVNMLQKKMLALKSETDLFVIDHLDYFDHEETNENKAVTSTLKRIRDLALLTGVPVILLCHVKKTDRRTRPLVPELDDLMGSSNISKISTKAVIIAPDYSGVPSTKKSGTFFRAGKFRVDGSVSRYIARCEFDIEENRYSKDFSLGTLSLDYKEFKPFEDLDQYPRWAR